MMIETSGQLFMKEFWAKLEKKGFRRKFQAELHQDFQRIMEYFISHCKTHKMLNLLKSDIYKQIIIDEVFRVKYESLADYTSMLLESARETKEK